MTGVEAGSDGAGRGGGVSADDVCGLAVAGGAVDEDGCADVTDADGDAIARRPGDAGAFQRCKGFAAGQEN